MPSLRTRVFASLVFPLLAVLAASQGCGSQTGSAGFDTTDPNANQAAPGDDDSGSGHDASVTAAPAYSDDGGGSSFVFGVGGDASAAPPPAAPPCKTPGLWCYVPDGCTTTLSGTVYDPAGKNPLYNVVVYVPADPSKPLPTITPGTHSCGSCDTQIADYMAVAVTDAKGHFSMSGVPATTRVPLVVQVGKWRREVYLSSVTACQDNPVPAAASRLPRSRTDGVVADLPQMAVLTGACDDLGCFMRGLGLDPSEYSAPHAGGRLDVYQGTGLLGLGGPALSSGTAGNCTTASCPLWASKQALEYYDMVLLACECGENNTTKPAAAMQAMRDWLDEGGKVFATHFQYTWFKNNPQTDFQNTATWLGASTGSGAGTYTIDTSFPKGQVFHDWLQNLGALTGNGIALNGVANSVSTVTPPTQRWIYDPGSSPNDTKYLSFLTPIGGLSSPPPSPAPTDAGADAGDGGARDAGAGDAAYVDAAAEQNQPTYCGKAVFSDLHTSGSPSGDVPASCSGADLTPQQKALEFLLFDLAACVAPENKPPPEPPPPPPPPPPPVN
jgi:hypothetical protein